ncbi:MAG: 3-deoxy-D-manno-octulosonate 8-phosphate phosphatase, partial [Cyclobacteriaceae bacterium]
MSNYKEDLGKIKAFAFDVDGVFSNDKLYLHPSGDMMRTMNIKDGYAIQYAVRKNYPVCIITGGNSEAVRKRFMGLGVTDIYLKAVYKKDCFDDFIY